MPELTLKGPAVIDGAVRYPIEGAISMTDDEAATQRANSNIDEQEVGSDDLENLTMIDLGLLVSKEGVPLNGATKKADMIAAIRKHREEKAASA